FLLTDFCNTFKGLLVGCCCEGDAAILLFNCEKIWETIKSFLYQCKNIIFKRQYKRQIFYQL
ncbi:MAG TPA: hypothetical protein VM682_07350, partial [Bacillus sp. (in: firmicutes)]|nr:hypothetical protein [Bacillus sp. (in: firmicutes)]